MAEVDLATCCAQIEDRVDRFVESLPCRDPAPYPEPRVTRPDPAVARMLLDAYANGGSAELTAVAQYINHHITIAEEALSNLELCISLVEMKHVELLGTLIRQLGLDPRYWRGNTAYWSGGNVSYGETTCERLRMDVESEEAAISSYNRLIQQIRDPFIVRVLQRIVADEMVHLQLFRQAVQQYCGSQREAVRSNVLTSARSETQPR